MTMTLAALLDELADYFDNKADAEIVDGRTHANKEMHLLSEIKAHIGAQPAADAWLIEAPGPHYLGVREIGHQHDFYWTKDANAALPFRSREQADLTAGAVRRLAPPLFDFAFTLGDAMAREHRFVTLSR